MQSNLEGRWYGVPSALPPTGTYYSNGQPIYHADGFFPAQDGTMLLEDYSSRMHQLNTMSSETLNSYSDIEEQHTATSEPSHTSARGKRRSIPGPDHVKHRRTRSGCYTCRQRRVKCDETHPTCDRCRKAKRECVYPELISSSSVKGARGSSRRGSGRDGSVSSNDDHDCADHERLPPILDDEDSPENAVNAGMPDATRSGWAIKKESDSNSPSSSPHPNSLPDSPAGEGDHKIGKTSSRPNLPRQQSRQKLKNKQPHSSKFARLPTQVKWYLNYHKEHLTYHHYSMKVDTGDFLKTTFLEIALSYEPLLYAITAFSAYHYTLSNPEGKLQDFLGYYNKSVTLLRESLAKSPKHSLQTVLAILQLATFEEFLGDWVNLLIHQRAAYQIITEIFQPETIMRSETHRKIIAWYIRFDLFAGFMSGHESVLGREWHVACADFYARQARDKPKDLGSLFEEKFARSRLIAVDIAFLFSQKQQGITSDEDFGMGIMSTMSELDRMKEELESAFKDTRQFVKEFPNAPASVSDSVVDSTDANFLWAGELFPWNFILIDFWAIYLLFKSQVAQFNPLISGEEVLELAFKVGKMFEALQYCDQDPTAMMLGAQASLGMAAACLPKDEKTVNWCRQKYATIESCGYLYPDALHNRLSDLWGVDVTKWWLDDETSQPPILKSIREFLEYRALDPQDDVATSLKSMKGLFSALNLEDSEGKEGISNSTGGTESDQLEFLAGSSYQGEESYGGFESSPEHQSWASNSDGLPAGSHGVSSPPDKTQR